MPNGFPYPPYDDFQMNPKINLSNLPSWDGNGETIIDYLALMSTFARLGERMKTGMAALAPQKWSGEKVVTGGTRSRRTFESISPAIGMSCFSE